MLAESKIIKPINGRGGHREGAGRPPVRLGAVGGATRQEVQAALLSLAPLAVKNVGILLKAGDWETTKWVLEKIDGKPVQAIHADVRDIRHITFTIVRARDDSPLQLPPGTD